MCPPTDIRTDSVVNLLGCVQKTIDSGEKSRVTKRLHQFHMLTWLANAWTELHAALDLTQTKFCAACHQVDQE